MEAAYPADRTFQAPPPPDIARRSLSSLPREIPFFELLGLFDKLLIFGLKLLALGQIAVVSSTLEKCANRQYDRIHGNGCWNNSDQGRAVRDRPGVQVRPHPRTGRRNGRRRRPGPAQAQRQWQRARSRVRPRITGLQAHPRPAARGSDSGRTGPSGRHPCRDAVQDREGHVHARCGHLSEDSPRWPRRSGKSRRTRGSASGSRQTVQKSQVPICACGDCCSPPPSYSPAAGRRCHYAHSREIFFLELLELFDKLLIFRLKLLALGRIAEGFAVGEGCLAFGYALFGGADFALQFFNAQQAEGAKVGVVLARRALGWRG